MIQDTVENLEKLGLDVAREVAGPDAVTQVEVVTGVDYFGRATYDFSILIDPERLRTRIGLVLIGLWEKLEDQLAARGDEHHVEVHLLHEPSWPRRADARTIV